MSPCGQYSVPGVCGESTGDAGEQQEDVPSVVLVQVVCAPVSPNVCHAKCKECVDPDTGATTVVQSRHKVDCKQQQCSYDAASQSDSPPPDDPGVKTVDVDRED